MENREQRVVDFSYLLTLSYGSTRKMDWAGCFPLPNPFFGTLSVSG